MVTNLDYIYTSEMDDTVLALYGAGASHTQVATQLGLTRTEFNTVRARDPYLDRLCEYGDNLAEVTLELIARDGAEGGIKNFNNTMLQFILKSRFPKTYGDKKGETDDGSSLLEKLTAGSLKIVRDNEQ